MQGQVLDYSIQTNEGIITTKDGQRYRFEGKEWKEATVPSRGMDVDFDVNENSCAVGVYRALKSSSNALSFGANSSSGPKGKNKIIAGLLALFLGGYGIHKFYLGLTVSGLVYLFCNLIFIGLAVMTEEPLFFLPIFIISIFALIDTVIYLTRSDEDFQRIYVEEKKQWF